MKKRTCENTIDLLIENGIDTFFLVTGGAIVPTIDYIGRNKLAKYYCFQHEQAAAMAAEGYYRTTGKVGAVLTTSGPGAQNLLNGICGCWYESIPCIFITGQVSTYESSDACNKNPRQLGFQETPVVKSFKPFTKYAKKIKTIKEVESVIKTAILKCKSGRFGPSLIDFPVNIQTSENEFKMGIVKHKKVDSWYLEAGIEELEYMLSVSKRPLILLGHGVRLSDSAEKAKKLINKFDIPFVVSWGGFDLIEHSHKRFIGDIGVYGKRGANFAVQNCDLLISIGSRLDTRQTGGDLKMFARDAKKVMVDIDSNELFKNQNRGLSIDLPIRCDAGLFIDGVLNNIKEVPDQQYNWIEKCKKWKNWVEEREIREDNILTSYEVVAKISTLVKPADVIIPDEGGHLVWCMQKFKIDNQRIFSNFGNSSMGYALPSAIGAAIGTGNRVKDYTLPDFERVAKAYGIESVTIEGKKDIDKKLNYVMSYEGPILCNIKIDPTQKLIPKLEFGNPLEDMYPYLTDKQISDNMVIKTIKRRDNTQGWVNLK